LKKTSRRKIDVNVDELDRIIDGAMREPLNETDGQTLKTAVHAMAERLVRGRNTEKTNAVLGDQDGPAPPEKRSPKRARTNLPGTDVMAPQRIAALRRLKSRTRVCTPAIGARNAGEAMSTNRRSRRHWCGSEATRSGKHHKWDKLFLRVRPPDNTPS
jgi:hypothetical protein